ncbi:MAG: shikimate kinase [Desulfobacterales bacterium]|jgi:shikimate kinase|nr:shikimate kinase [Desulfobacterales bacterium]
MNVVLIGYRGTGKSVVSRILADRLAMAHVGMDSEIVRRAKLTIPEIVEKYGWTGFRDRETSVARDLSGKDNLVIDTGGGVIERPENMLLLGQNARIFWLKATVTAIVSRIQSDVQRPALVEGKTFIEEVAEVLETRIPKYKTAAHYEINTDDLTPEEVADKIIGVLR